MHSHAKVSLGRRVETQYPQMCNKHKANLKYKEIIKLGKLKKLLINTIDLWLTSSHTLSLYHIYWSAIKSTKEKASSKQSGS